jgi:hypothetical protein
VRQTLAVLIVLAALTTLLTALARLLAATLLLLARLLAAALLSTALLTALLATLLLLTALLATLLLLTRTLIRILVLAHFASFRCWCRSKFTFDAPRPNAWDNVPHLAWFRTVHIAIAPEPRAMPANSLVNVTTTEGRPTWDAIFCSGCLAFRFRFCC